MKKRIIRVDMFEAFRYMGCRGTPDGDLLKDLEKAAKLVAENALSREVLRICNIERTSGLSLKETGLILEGKAAAALLHNSEKCIIFCATLGGEIEALIRKWQLKDLAFSAMLDACANSAIENLCDDIEIELRQTYTAQGQYLTDRFSPGYGDLPITLQPAFCAALNTARLIGVSVSENSIMIPRKSVSALIGISNLPQKHRDTGCADCSVGPSCNYIRNGVTCYGQAL